MRDKINEILKGAPWNMEIDSLFVPKSKAIALRSGGDDSWECYTFIVTLRRVGVPGRGEPFSTAYRLGLAYHKEKGRSKGADMTRRAAMESGHGVESPQLADVMHSLSDARFGAMVYDSDSRRAVAMHSECEVAERAMRDMFSSGELEKLEELFQDY